MGVIDLWQILSPACESCRSVADVAKIVAIDTSIWIRQSELVQGVKDANSLRPHIKNVFWRTIGLLKQKVVPVFVLEGAVSSLKEEMLQKRHPETLIMCRNTSSRSKFSNPSQECGTLLGLLGVTVVEASEEAEAACADLNARGIVDGCVTEDGDAFLFGACTVFRHFSGNHQRANELCVYSMVNISAKLNLDRRKLIAFALLVGCDYVVKGVPGIGSKTAIEWLGMLNEDPIVRLLTLKSDLKLKQLEEWGLSQKNKKPSHCTMCGHSGTRTCHQKSGCLICGQTDGCLVSTETDCSCEWHQTLREYDRAFIELKIRRFAMDDPLFPDLRVINAFLNPVPTKVVSTRQELLNVKKPNFENLCKFLETKLEWPLDKTIKAVLPVMTNYFLKFTTREECRKHLKPLRVLKSYPVRGVLILKILWERIDSIQLGPSDAELTTTEEEDVMLQIFPDVVESFRRTKQTQNLTNRKRKLTTSMLTAERTKKGFNYFQIVKEQSSGKTSAKLVLSSQVAKLNQQRGSFKTYEQKQKQSGGFMTSYNHNEHSSVCETADKVDKYVKNVHLASTLSEESDDSLSSVSDMKTVHSQLLSQQKLQLCEGDNKLSKEFCKKSIPFDEYLRSTVCSQTASACHNLSDSDESIDMLSGNNKLTIMADIKVNNNATPDVSNNSAIVLPSRSLFTLFPAAETLTEQEMEQPKTFDSELVKSRVDSISNKQFNLSSMNESNQSKVSSMHSSELMIMSPLRDSKHLSVSELHQTNKNSFSVKGRQLQNKTLAEKKVEKTASKAKVNKKQISNNKNIMQFFKKVCDK